MNMVTTIDNIRKMPEPHQVETQDTELEYLTVGGNVNIFCPHCGHVLWNGIENNRGMCESCYGAWKRK